MRGKFTSTVFLIKIQKTILTNRYSVDTSTVMPQYERTDSAILGISKE